MLIAVKVLQILCIVLSMPNRQVVMTTRRTSRMGRTLLPFSVQDDIMTRAVLSIKNLVLNKNLILDRG